MKEGEDKSTETEKIRHVTADDVGIIFQGNYNAPGEGPTVVMQLASFRRLTGIDASGPAMVAICRLLEEEVTPRQVSKVWRDELVFEQGQFTLRVGRYIPVPWLMCISFGLFALCSVVLWCVVVLGGKNIPTETAICALLYLASLMTFLFVGVKFHQPYMVCKRIAPVLERVNADLPSRIETWKRGLRI
ncbi:hypothetical protein [Ralstonia pseudosolanacearum]